MNPIVSSPKERPGTHVSHQVISNFFSRARAQHLPPPPCFLPPPPPTTHAMSRPWVLVTPSSRGIGFALTRHLLRTTTLPILATARRDPSAVKARLLQDLGDLPSPPATTSAKSPPPAAAAAPEDRLHVLPLDVTSEPTVEAAAQRARELFPPDGGGEGGQRYHLRLAFAVPGVLHPEKSLAQVDAGRALETYRVNALGPLLLMKHFAGFLPRRRTRLLDDGGGEGGEHHHHQQQQHQHPPGEEGGSGAGGAAETRLPPQRAVWLNMSARVGSVSDNRKGGWYSYRSSKAAVNALTRTFDLHLAAASGDRAMAVAYHPGTVRTDLSREFWATVEEGKLFEVGYAVERMVKVVTEEVGIEGRGRCWDWKGEEILP